MVTLEALCSGRLSRMKETLILVPHFNHLSLLWYFNSCMNSSLTNRSTVGGKNINPLYSKLATAYPPFYVASYFPSLPAYFPNNFSLPPHQLIPQLPSLWSSFSTHLFLIWHCRKRLPGQSEFWVKQMTIFVCGCTSLIDPMWDNKQSKTSCKSFWIYCIIITYSLSSCQIDES